MIHSLVFATLALLVAAQSPRPTNKQPFIVVESTIREMQTAMQQGRITSREIVQQYLTRIATYEDKLNAIIVVNPHALEEAEARARERVAGNVRGPLQNSNRPQRQHPYDRPADHKRRARVRWTRPPYEATLTKNLRDAGANIIAKTKMTELANWVATGPIF
jgi:amidase